jgi:PST family polysaccharide transporter
VNDTPELAPVIRVLSILVLVIGLNIIQQAVMQRRMEFRKLALRSNVAALVGGVAGVALAIEGAGIWALVTQQIATDTTALVLIWIVSPWRPRWRFSRRHAMDLLGFSLDVFGANVGGFVGRRADVLLMGIFFGPAVVGLYRLADRLVDTVIELTTRPIVLVSLPLFSRLQDDRDGLRDAVRSCLRATIVVIVPSMLVVVACSPYLVAAIGPEWEPASQALQLLALAGIVKGIVYFAGPLLFATGRPRLRAGVLWAFALFGVVTVAAIGMILSSASQHDQLLGMSATRALGYALVVLPVNLLIILRLADLPLREVLPSLPLPLAAGLGAVGGVEAISAIGVTDSMAALPALIVAVAAAFGASLAVVLIAMLAGGPERRARLLAVFRAVRRRPGSEERLGDAAFGWLLGPERSRPSGTPNVE